MSEAIDAHHTSASSSPTPERGPGATGGSKNWSEMLCRSRSRWYDFAARRNCEWKVIDALDQLATRSGGGGPAYGDAATYTWRLPGGSAEWSRGMFGAHGVWINGIVPLLLVCQILELTPPRFATPEQRAEAALPVTQPR